MIANILSVFIKTFVAFLIGLLLLNIQVHKKIMYTNTMHAHFTITLKAGLICMPFLVIYPG